MKARIVLWVLAFLVAILSARYFLDPPIGLRQPAPSWVPDSPVKDAAENIAPYLFENHRALFLTHIACGILAITLGLFQFLAPLRSARPAVHRLLGSVYVGAVIIGGATGLPLSLFLADAGSDSIRPQFFPLVVGFGSLSVAWIYVTTVAFLNARRRRLEQHRAWMIRSYALTFAAVTTRIVAPILLVATRDVALAVQAAILSWPLNLIVAEWLIRRRQEAPALAASESA